MKKILYKITSSIHHLSYKPLIAIMKRQRIHKFIILHDHPRISGSAIYAINHSCKHDMPYVSELLGRQSYVLAGKQRLKLLDRLCFLLNGVLWVDRKDTGSRKKARQDILSLLLMKEQVCMFPEGTWNLTPSKPMLPLY